MNTKKNKQLYLDELVKHLLEMKDHEQMENAIRNLLTPSELTEISKRLQIFKLLREGMPQRQIAEKLGVGIATVTRGSRALREMK